MAALSKDEMDNLARYILNKKATKSVATREVFNITIKNLAVQLKG